MRKLEDKSSEIVFIYLFFFFSCGSWIKERLNNFNWIKNSVKKKDIT